MSFGLGSSDLLEIRRLQAITCANNPKITPGIFEGPVGPPGPTGPPGPAAYMNGGYVYIFSLPEEGVPNGCFSLSPGKDILHTTQLQISLISANGVYMNDYFFQIPIGSRAFLYNKSNGITHSFVIKSYVRYNGIYIFEVMLTTPISYSPSAKEEYIISFSIRGEGLPGGGIKGQILSKVSNNDFDVSWVSPSSALQLPYIARGRIPNSSDIAYKTLSSSKKWSGNTYILNLTGADMSNLTLSGDPSVFIKGTFTGQQQWTMTYNIMSGNATTTTILPPSFVGNAKHDGTTIFSIVSAGSNIPISGSGTSWILWNL